MIIGIDHGFGFIKTANCIFKAGVEKMKNAPAFTEQLLFFEGFYYSVGVSSPGIISDKTSSEDYYILTLAAIAEEMKIRKLAVGNITLAVGIPLTRYGSEKEGLISYLQSRNEVIFTYENKNYNITINKNIKVYPQGYAAIAPYLQSIKGTCNIVDVGTGTTELLPINSDKKPDLHKAKTLQIGIANCISDVNEQIARVFGEELSEDQIIDVIIGNETIIPSKARDICIEEISSFTEALLNIFKQNKINYNLTPTYFIGGGANLIKNFSRCLKEENECIHFITDIKANARGYEALAKASTKDSIKE